MFQDLDSSAYTFLLNNRRLQPLTRTYVLHIFRLYLQDVDTFDLEHLEFKTLAQYNYLEPGSVKNIYFYQYTQ